MSAIASVCASRIAALHLAVKPHATLLHNVSSIAGGTFASAVLGFAYWVIAARCFSLEAVGLAAAAVSIMNLIGLFAQLGLGTLLMGESHSRGKNGPGLISAALAISFVTAIVFGTIFIVAAREFSLDLGGITDSQLGSASFVLGCGVTAVALLLNNAFVGLLRGSLQMYQNVAFSLTKLILLLALALNYGSGAHAQALFGTWVAGQLICASFFTALLRRFNRGRLPVPRFEALFPLMRAAFSHHLLDLVIQAPALIMPFLVTVIVSPSVNAAFNAAWMTLRTTFLLPDALSMVLFAIGISDPKAFAARVRFAIFVLAIAAIGVTLLFASFSNLILSLFSPEYGTIAANSLRLLGLSFLGAAVKSFYLAIQRLKRRMIYASRIFALGGFVELAFALVGGQIGGLLGLSAGWTAAVLLQAAFMAPAVLRAGGFRWSVATEFLTREQKQGYP